MVISSYRRWISSWSLSRDVRPPSSLRLVSFVVLGIDPKSRRTAARTHVPFRTPAKGIGLIFILELRFQLTSWAARISITAETSKQFKPSSLNWFLIESSSLDVASAAS